MATGALIAGGAKAVGGIAGGYQAGKQSEKAMGNALLGQMFSLQANNLYMNEAKAAGMDSLEYAQKMLADWEDTFGGIEQNLSDYYNNLDPAKYAEQYKSNLYSDIDKQSQQLTEGLASQGLLTSGMKAQNDKEASFAKAQGGAQADLMAEDKVNAMKQGFVNTGANRLNNANSSVINANNNLANLSAQQAGASSGIFNNYSNTQYNSGLAYGGSSGGFLKAGLDGIGEVAGAM